MLRTVSLLTMLTVAVSSCQDATSPVLPPTPSPTRPILSPASTRAGSPDLTVTITGSGFAVHSQMVWVTFNGDTIDLATTFVDTNRLSAIVPAALLSSPGSARVFVEIGDPLSDAPLVTSPSVIFDVAARVAPRPIVVAPAVAAAGSPDLTVTVTGAGFDHSRRNSSWVVWVMNGQRTTLATTFVTATQLMAVVPEALLSAPAIAEVFVETGDPRGDTAITSGPATFTVWLH